RGPGPRPAPPRASRVAARLAGSRTSPSRAPRSRFASAVATRIANLGPPNPGPARCDTVAEPERAQRLNRVRRDDEAESRLVEFRLFGHSARSHSGRGTGDESCGLRQSYWDKASTRSDR